MASSFLPLSRSALATRAATARVSDPDTLIPAIMTSLGDWLQAVGFVRRSRLSSGGGGSLPFYDGSGLRVPLVARIRRGRRRIARLVRTVLASLFVLSGILARRGSAARRRLVGRLAPHRKGGSPGQSKGERRPPPIGVARAREEDVPAVALRD